MLPHGSPPVTGIQWLRLAGNAFNWSTPLGLAVATLGRSRIRPGPGGLILADGYRLSFPIAGAFTIGSVLITAKPDWARYLDTRPEALEHERRHTWQWLALGPAFLPAYAISMGWSWLRTGDRAAANVFERLAGLAAGGYPQMPNRPLREGVRAAIGAACCLVGRPRPRLT